MLRIHYMPSDFHPLLLIVGERSDVSQLHQFFEGLSSNLAPTNVNELSFVTTNSFPVVITPLHSQRVMGLTLKDTNEEMLWVINPQTAEAFASELCDALETGSNSGSCFLEIGYVGEIRAKVAFGEFDDDYLLNGE